MAQVKLDLVWLMSAWSKLFGEIKSEFGRHANARCFAPRFSLPRRWHFLALLPLQSLHLHWTSLLIHK